MEMRRGEEAIAEYNMGQFDYERIHKLIEQLHNYGIEIKNPEREKELGNLLLRFCSVLYEVYKCVRPALSKPKKEKYDGEFKNHFSQIISWREKIKRDGKIEIPWKTLINPLEELENEILEEKHRIMGFPVVKYMPRDKKIRRGLGV